MGTEGGGEKEVKDSSSKHAFLSLSGTKCRGRLLSFAGCCRTECIVLLPWTSFLVDLIARKTPTGLSKHPSMKAKGVFCTSRARNAAPLQHACSPAVSVDRGSCGGVGKQGLRHPVRRAHTCQGETCSESMLAVGKDSQQEVADTDPQNKTSNNNNNIIIIKNINNNSAGMSPSVQRLQQT